MDANPNPVNGAPGSTGDQDMDSSAPRPYVQQFSASTAMILQRIKSGVGGLGVGMIGQGAAPPPGYEDMKKSVLQGMKTSMNMELPQPLSAQARRLAKQSPVPAGSLRGSGTGGNAGSYVTPYGKSASSGGGSGRGRKQRSAKAGSKRKRVKSESISAEDSEDLPDLGDDSDSDDSGSVVMPRMTQSGRQIVKPAQFVPSPAQSSRKRAPSKRSQEEKNEQALCKRCGRGHSPQNNLIVFCDGCNLPWHQMCHDPAISAEAVQDETADWFCADCSKKKGITPRVEPPKDISWQDRTVEFKKAYFQSLTHEQLVSLLVQATSLQPNLPIFPSSWSQPPSRAASQSQDRKMPTTHAHQPFPPSAATSTGLFSRTESNPNATMNFIRKINTAENSPSPSIPTNNNQQASSAPPSLQPVPGEEDADGSRESTPASPPYPKPGMGLMAKLGPDDQDDEWLVDNSDFEAFSHVVFQDTENSGTI
ncbi:phd finger domain-containing protein [Phlyctema vagabunda]|uniref:Phd finger domain-containing protein n=1 Tax=Phlyctema vagabunda TaxID=108571 RepID=A0ABR4PWN6_9HELO